MSPSDPVRQAAAAAYAAALQPVRRRFIDTAESRILLIEALKQEIARNLNCDEAIREISRIAHKISGTAATLGYTEVGSLATRVERLLEPDARRLPTMDRWHEAKPVLETLLDALEAILDD